MDYNLYPKMETQELNKPEPLIGEEEPSPNVLDVQPAPAESETANMGNTEIIENPKEVKTEEAPEKEIIKEKLEELKTKWNTAFEIHKAIEAGKKIKKSNGEILNPNKPKDRKKIDAISGRFSNRVIEIANEISGENLKQKVADETGYKIGSKNSKLVKDMFQKRVTRMIESFYDEQITKLENKTQENPEPAVVEPEPKPEPEIMPTPAVELEPEPQAEIVPEEPAPAPEIVEDFSLPPIQQMETVPEMAQPEQAPEKPVAPGVAGLVAPKPNRQPEKGMLEDDDLVLGEPTEEEKQERIKKDIENYFTKQVNLWKDEKNIYFERAEKHLENCQKEKFWDKIVIEGKEQNSVYEEMKFFRDLSKQRVERYQEQLEKEKDEEKKKSLRNVLNYDRDEFDRFKIFVDYIEKLQLTTNRQPEKEIELEDADWLIPLSEAREEEDFELKPMDDLQPEAEPTPQEEIIDSEYKLEITPEKISNAAMILGIKEGATEDEVYDIAAKMMEGTEENSEREVEIRDAYQTIRHAMAEGQWEQRRKPETMFAKIGKRIRGIFGGEK